jgi:hypothetical protein
MVSNDVKHELLKAWIEYGEAIKSAFRFPPSAHIIAEGLDDFFQDRTDDLAREFISYVRQKTEEVRLMKFVGEK